ncbi:Uncharacterised protein [Mycobacteroides abscessus subsp. abscessus]|nr:Uncharacterised protein [Mycobacteroides abscessus subsp. abscessus]
MVPDASEVDIVEPELKLAIGSKGLYWHSERTGRDNECHIRPERAAAGLRLIHVWEDD